MKRQHASSWPPRAGRDFAERYPLFMRAGALALWATALVVLGKVVVTVMAEPRVYGQDSHAYWLAAQGDLVYNSPAGTVDAYLYSPAFLTLISPLTWLPWPVFLGVWTCLLIGVAAWLVKPLNWKWSVPLFLCSLAEVLVSNIFLLLALAAVIGMRRPAAWAFPILTKVTMGVGLLWFAARGEWRLLLEGFGATGLVVVVLYLVDPSGWHAWVEFLLTNRDGTKDGALSFALRCFVAVALVVVGARKNWGWVIAPAMLLASPVLVSVVPLALLVAIPRLTLATAPAASAADSQSLPWRSDAKS